MNKTTILSGVAVLRQLPIAAPISVESIGQGRK